MNRLLKESVVYRHPHWNAYHPSVVCLSALEWVVTHDLGTSPHTLDYHTQAIKTQDGGETWKVLGRLLPESAELQTTHTIRVRRFSDGRLLGFGKWEDRSVFLARRSNPMTGGQVPMQLFLITSDDAGGSWSSPRWIIPPLEGPTWELCHPPIELPDGSWGAPVATWKDWEGNLPEGQQTGILVSEDAGATWPHFSRTFDGRESGLLHWEQSVVTLGDGRLLATAWVFNPATGQTGASVFSMSDDSGRNFGPPRKTGFQAQTCKLLALEGNRVLAVYRRVDQPGLWAELARVQDDTWSPEECFLLYDGSGVMGGSLTTQLDALEFGYPAPARLDREQAVVLFWCREGVQTILRSVIINISEEGKR